MNAPTPAPSCYEFDFPRLDTVVEVEPLAEGVVIRASRPTFSEQRKQCFIRELAAEGFIDEACRWREPGSPGGVRWVVDRAAFLPGAECRNQTRRFMVRLVLSAAALWLVLVTSVLLSAGR